MTFALAVLIGMSLGALGSGGSIVTTPVLVYFAHVAPHTAIGMSLAIVGATSLAGSLWQHRQGNVHPKALLLIGLAGSAGAFAGSGYTHLVSPRTLMLIFAAILLAVSATMFGGGAGRLRPGQCRPVRCLSAGFGAGLLTGFLGVGGGFLLVPVLVVVAGLDVRKAAGTSLAIISLNSLAGLAGHLRYVDMNWKLVAGFLAFSLAGMGLGLAAARRLPDAALRKVFATLLAGTGIAVAGVNLFR